jgi:non-specific serine/threonine protein kinase
VRGLHYLAHLIRHPGEEFHARDLVLLGVPREERPREGGAGPVLDGAARSDYRRRLEELREELEEADRFNDTGRAARAREEMEFIAHELSAAVELGGRDREAASAAERARLAVTKRIKAALSAIREHHPALGRHLDQSVRTGRSAPTTRRPRRSSRGASDGTDP